MGLRAVSHNVGAAIKETGTCCVGRQALGADGVLAFSGIVSGRVVVVSEATTDSPYTAPEKRN
jgi:hypothetical protein